MNYNNVKEKNLEYFTGLLDESNDEHHVVAQSKISHIKRFEKILELGDFNRKTLLDVGCGIGGFYDFLEERGIHCDYTGFDINSRMIEAAKEKHPEIKNKFAVLDIIEEDPGRMFDYIISNGPLNLKFDLTLNIDMTMKLIRQMVRFSTIGTVITMTSSLTRKPNDETYYYNPAEILA
jgi:SAM-dependent methyltransferase